MPSTPSLLRRLLSQQTSFRIRTFGVADRIYGWCLRTPSRHEGQRRHVELGRRSRTETVVSAVRAVAVVSRHGSASQLLEVVAADALATSGQRGDDQPRIFQ